MKLGIAVVYLVAEEDERLLDLHLSQIEDCTRVPYRVYASVNRLLPRFRSRLEQRSFVQLCNIPGTTQRNHSEHAYYLDRLVEAAVDDGATHLCTLHVDSFPVRKGWAKKLAPKLKGNCVLASSLRDEKWHRKPSTDFMLFTREFYLAHRPTFLLPPTVLASEQYQRYHQACPHLPDSGVGYGFKIWSEQLTWLPIPRVARREPSYQFGSLYGDLVFHLGGAVRNHQEPLAATPAQTRRADLLGLLRPAAKKILPEKLRRRLSGVVEDLVVKPKFAETRARLLADPDRFLRQLQQESRGDIE